MLWQPSLPEKYTRRSDDDLEQAIIARKRELGDQLVILGHHYQQDQVIQFADFTGDSFKLSQLAAEKVEKTGAKYVVFCGVHFMAESADILTPDDTAVILPDLSAGCSMADMADIEEALDAWAVISDIIDDDNVRVIPICYMNSSAAIKAFCGEHGGAVCTSSNCDKVFRWALAGGDTPRGENEQIKILFLPDQHLGRNTAAAMGYDPVANMALWDPKDANGCGGLEEHDIQRATFLLWKGHCSVHKLFRPEHVDQVRAQWPDVQVIVHPECAYEVVQKADHVGSTEKIRTAIENADPGSRWAIGTEVHMVNRLCNAAAERGVQARILSSCQCLCTTMYRIDLPHLLWVLDQLAAGKVVNQIRVHPQVRHWALAALNRMLQINRMTFAPGSAPAPGITPGITPEVPTCPAGRPPRESNQMHTQALTPQRAETAPATDDHRTFAPGNHHVIEQTSPSPITDFRVDVEHAPRHQWIQIQGPGRGVMLQRHGSTNVFNPLTAVRNLIRPGMSDLEKAMAIYRFAARNYHGAGIGFGNIDTSLFMNAFGYSFCYGQADFQQHLYQAAGLGARTPGLPGHATVEVFIDGQWRMMDAFMRLLAPSMALDGLATGAELAANPQRFDHVRPDPQASTAKTWWATHQPSGTYEPPMALRSMELNLRRGESLTFAHDHREAWCLSNDEPVAFCNGVWRYRSVLDREHLTTGDFGGEVLEHDNLRVGDAGGLEPIDTSRPARLIYAMNSPYPWVRASLSIDHPAGKALRVRASNDGGLHWHDLTPAGDGRIDLSSLCSHPKRPDNDAHTTNPEGYIRRRLLVELAWTGKESLSGFAFDGLVQLHRRVLPWLDRGVNLYRIIGLEKTGAVKLGWTAYPNLTASSDKPFEGENVTFTTAVRNQSRQTQHNVPVRFVQQGTDHVLGETVIDTIPPGQATNASVTWTAKAIGDRGAWTSEGNQVQVQSPRYVGTTVNILAGEHGESVGVTHLVVQPRPLARFSDGLTYACRSDNRAEAELTLRAAVVHMLDDPDRIYVYLPDTKLSVTVQPYLGHPDQGGLALAEPRELTGILASEFAVAQWRLPAHALPETFDVWFEVRNADRDQRLLGKVTVEP